MQNFIDQLHTVNFWLKGMLPFALVVVFYLGTRLLLRKLWREHNLTKLWGKLFWPVFVIAMYQPLVLFFPQLKRGLYNLGRIFTSPLLNEDSGLSLLSLLLLIPIFFVVSRLTKILVKLLEQKLGHNRVLQQQNYKGNVKAPLLTISHYFLLLLFGFLGINLVGINMSSLGVVLGALGLGIGLGLQNMAANFVSGITLLLNGNIQPGDFVRTPRASGKIERINLMSTILLTMEQENLIIPNQYLLNEIIENASYDNNRIVQLHLPLGVSYNSDLNTVIALVKKILDDNPYYPQVLNLQNNSSKLPPKIAENLPQNTATAKNENHNNGPKSDIWLKGFGSSALDFEVLMMIENIDEYRAATHWFYMQVWREFKENNVVIPFSQMDVHIYDAEGKKVRSVTGFGS